MKKKFIICLFFAMLFSNISLGVIMKSLAQNKIDYILTNKESGILVFSLGISFFVTVFTGMMTFKLFNKYVMNKISIINNYLKRIQEGNYEDTIGLNSSDELGHIAKNINKIKEKIKSKEEELIIKQEQIHYLSYYDTLTGLPNRMLFEKNLSKMLEEARKNNEKLALLYLDLDNFKKVNDTIGHTFGDLLLRNVGILLKKCICKEGIITRMGGDEFVAILPKADKKSDIMNCVEKISKSFQNPWLLDDREFYITVSMGIAIYPDHGENVHMLLKNADTAMYAAKKQCKKSYHFYTSDMNIEMLEKLEIENSLRHAVERNEFLIYYQPKININNENISGVEALIRWKHPNKGFIPPNVFIPIAEETGLIIPIGEWVLKTACRQIRVWQELGYTPVYISVNVSVIQIKQPNFVDMVKGIIKETGIKPYLLELEITENAIMEDFELTNKILDDLRKLGIVISLDDFGKGYSSLNYLKQLEINVLKIDKSFVDDITENNTQQAIVKAVIEMAHSMDMSVVAEGVETWEQFKYLKDLQCDKVQGYLFSRPLPLIEMEDMMRKKKKVG
ncbi:EAL domain-containing protein [Crassaminicella thermophila]|uniref:EAL domain-containing protein n=1 Tax=Crassaminicella thermophila TaxID=2599308 RepID=A0A5C0SA48_CRATE|nr:EAL domain-containing protein [Crassaminicella thermophila]QEK11001.1 EAL domain-containing protein [Crassaminicella thermophila]